LEFRRVLFRSKSLDAEQAWLRLKGARGNNLQSVDLAIPAGHFVCITGVSGSGKSTLINDTLATAVSRTLHRAHAEPAPYDTLEGLEHFDKIITVDRKSTRLNSSHVKISYAVFCLKKKKDARKLSNNQDISE